MKLKISVFKILYLEFFYFFSAEGIFFRNCILTKKECPNENITFWLYTNETGKNPIKLDESNLKPDVFLSGQSLKILIHGYTGHKDFDPNPQIRPILLRNFNLNVISVDYGPLVEAPCYVQAVLNLDTVAKCTGRLLNSLIESNIFKIEDIHVIGFSLGAQVAGLTANYMNSKLKRITGLDPARPGFITKGKNATLDSSDAQFVDVIHTDVLGRGVLLETGHVDFYPNGGTTQPGCKEQNLTSTGSCNHARAPEYYGESIETKIGFYGYNCQSWVQYSLGKCKITNKSKTEKMGYFVAESARGSYFLLTNDKKPFAREVRRIWSDNGVTK